MILIDDRAGSMELHPHMPPGRSILQRLEFGDCLFLGNGPNSALAVCIEVKTLSDVLDCICTGRFAGHQLWGMAQRYDVLYLLMLGRYRPCPETGLLQVGPGVGPPSPSSPSPSNGGKRDYWHTYTGIDSFQAFIGWRNSMQILSWLKWGKPLFIIDQLPYHGRPDHRYKAAAEVVMGLESWWGKPFGSHKSLDVFRRELPGPKLPAATDMTEEGAAGARAGYKDRHSLLRLWASCLPNVGWRRSAAAEGYFGSALEMAMADEEEWVGVEGIGKVTAGKIVGEVRKGKGEAA